MNPTFQLGRIAGIRIGINWSWLIIFALIVWSLAAAVFPSQNPGFSEGEYIVLAVVAALLFLLRSCCTSSDTRCKRGEKASRSRASTSGSLAAWRSSRAAFRVPAPSSGSRSQGPSSPSRLGFSSSSSPASQGSRTRWTDRGLARFHQPHPARLQPAACAPAGWWPRAPVGPLAFQGRSAVGDVGGCRSRARVRLSLHRPRALHVHRRGSIRGAWLAFVGWFLLQAATAEARYVATKEALDGLRVRDLMIREPVTVEADLSLAQFMDDVARSRRFTTYPVLEHGRPIGLLAFRSVASVPRDEWETRLARDAMIPRDEVPALGEDEPAIDALAELSTSGVNRGLVVDDGTLVGLLSITDLARALEVGRPSRPARPRTPERAQ